MKAKLDRTVDLIGKNITHDVACGGGVICHDNLCATYELPQLFALIVKHSLSVINFESHFLL
jgi:hypothetical protein